MLTLASTWWLLCLLIHVPAIANAFAVAWCKRIAGTRDHAIPDHLPQTAAQWVRERLPDGVTLAVVDKTATPYTNCYRPQHKLIQLTEEIAFKADPTCWATAAHELGHATMYERWPRVMRVVDALGLVKVALATIAIGMLVGNFFFAIHTVEAIAHVALIVALALHVLTLAEEAGASMFAYHELYPHPSLWTYHLKAARAVLLGAFGTYLSIWLSYALLLSQWDVIVTITGSGRYAGPSQLTTLGWFLALGASLVCAAYIPFALYRIARPLVRRDAVGVLIIEASFRIALLMLLYLVWDLREGNAWVWCVLLAFVPVQGLFTTAVAIPGVPLVLFARRIAHKLDGPGWHRSVEWSRAFARNKHEVTEGNRFVASLLPITVPLTRRLLALVTLAHIPLLVALWVR